MHNYRKQVMIIFIVLFVIAGSISFDHVENNEHISLASKTRATESLMEVEQLDDVLQDIDLSDQLSSIKASKMVYRYPLQVDLVYELKDDNRYIAKTELFHITSYGKPTMMITYVVDTLHREYDNYMTQFDLDYIPTLRLFFYDDLDHFTDIGPSEDYSAFQSSQEIHFRMPNTYEFAALQQRGIEEEIVYRISIHEFMHIMQYNKNNFALGTYEEPWLLEAMAEYGSMLLNPIPDEMKDHNIQVKNMEELREDPWYRYDYGEYIVEYIMTLEKGITFKTIMDNHDIALYFAMTDNGFFNGWIDYMSETYNATGIKSKKNVSGNH